MSVPTCFQSDSSVLTLPARYEQGTHRAIIDGIGMAPEGCLP